MTSRDRSITATQYRRVVAEQLDVEIERHVRAGTLRDEWEEPVEEVQINLVEVNARLGSGRVIPDLADGAVIAEFE